MSKMTTNKKKTYFIAPGFDWPIETGPVQLGNIVLGLDKPHQPISSTSGAVPNHYSTEQTDWHGFNQKFLSGSATVYAQFLSTFGIDAEMGLQLAKTDTEIFKFDRLATKEFVPSKAYVEERMKADSVQDEIKNNRIKAFMVTGLKLAYNPVMYHLLGGSKGAHAKILTDFTALGVPLKIGPDVGIESGKVKITSTRGGSDIVFAYQLTRIDYTVVKGTPVVKTAPLVKGAYMNTDGPPRAIGKMEVVEEVRVDGVFDENVKPVDAVVKSVADDIDGQEVECVMLDLVLDSDDEDY